MNYKTAAEARAITPDGAKVFCSYDEIVAIKDLKPNPGNPNKHPQRQLETLGEIIAATGWRAPITVSRRSGLMVKGHGRRMAALFQNLEWAPVEYQNYTSEAEEHADLIADNRIAELAELDTTKLIDMLQDIDTGELPVELSGFTTEDLERILNAINGTDDAADDKADAEPAQDEQEPPRSKLGDLWHLGSHRLLCGSATDEKDIGRLMACAGGKLAQMVHTDPPYGVSFTGSGRDYKAWAMIKNDDKTHDELLAGLLIPAFRNYVKYTKEDAAFYIWHASSTVRDFSDAMTAAGIVEKQYIIWVKNNFVIAHNDYQWKHKPCFYAEKAGQTAKWCGDRSQVTTWTATLRDEDGMATTLSGGVVLTDGAGGKVYLNETPPKGKKIRYIRLSKGRSITLCPSSKESTVWEIAKESKAIHPTQKPLEIPTRAINNSSEPGDLVLDFFGGSGSTLIAAEMLGRVCYSTELDPVYIDKIVKRYVETTGNANVFCERDGQEITYKELFEEAAGSRSTL